MEEVSTLANIIETIGVPLLFFVIAAYLLFKCFPQYMEAKKKEAEQSIVDRKEQQEYYNKRQEQYDVQMQTILKVAEQGNQMIGQATQIIAQSNEIIRMNTEAIKQNSLVHDKVTTALGNDLIALQTLTADLKVHDHRAEKIYTGIEKILDRTG